MSHQDGDTPPPQKFGPLMNVQPGPVTSRCVNIDGRLVAIHFEHSTGSTQLIVPLDFAKGLIAQLQEVTGGIVVASGPVTPVDRPKGRG